MKYFFTLFLCLFIATFLDAQSFINGSFETTSAPMSCQYNLSNASFNSMMSGVVGYGPGEELDILVAGCYNPGMPDGARAVGVADFPSDEISIPVSPALVAGQSYTFTFFSYAELSFRVRGDIEIGASTSSTTFGTLIFTAATQASTWIQHTVTFVAPNNATHITVRNITDGIVHWNHVDNFRFTVLLSMKLQNFRGKLVENFVQLDWDTETELDNDYFVVERSPDGLSWEYLEKLPGAGSSNVAHEYRSIDPNPMPGNNYYRLRQVDFDGNVNYSNTVSIEYKLQDDARVQIYPNPSSGVLHLRLLSSTKVSSVQIADALGQLVFQTQNQITTFDLSELPMGIYWVKVQLEDGTANTKKIVLKQ